MTRWQRSVTMLKASWAVLRSDHSIARFPVYQGLVSVAAVAVFALLAVVTIGESTDAAGATQYTPGVATVVIGFVGYITLAYIQTYFLAGLVAMAHARLHGHPTSVSDGLRAANSRAGRLLPWAILTGTLSWILQAIEERAGIVGNIVAGLIGAAWSIVTFLAVPVIVFEDVGPIDALKRSGTLLKRTWGENIIGQAGIGIVGIVVFLPLIAIGALGAMSGVTVVVITTVAFVVLAGLVAAVVLSTLSGIFRAALYSFAVDGTVPQAFAGADIEHAFGPRKGAGRISR